MSPGRYTPPCTKVQLRSEAAASYSYPVIHQTDMCVHVHESRRTHCEAQALTGGIFFPTAGTDNGWFRFCFHVQQRSKKSGWSPFATKRRPPSPPPQESIFESNPDAAVVAEALRATIGAAAGGGAKPRRAPNGKHY